MRSCDSESNENYGLDDDPTQDGDNPNQDDVCVSEFLKIDLKSDSADYSSDPVLVVESIIKTNAEGVEEIQALSEEASQDEIIEELQLLNQRVEHSQMLRSTKGLVSLQTQSSSQRILRMTKVQ